MSEQQELLAIRDRISAVGLKTAVIGEYAMLEQCCEKLLHSIPSDMLETLKTELKKQLENEHVDSFILELRILAEGKEYVFAAGCRVKDQSGRLGTIPALATPGPRPDRNVPVIFDGETDSVDVDAATLQNYYGKKTK